MKQSTAVSSGICGRMVRWWDARGVGNSECHRQRRPESVRQPVSQSDTYRHFRDDVRIVARERSAGRVNGRDVTAENRVTVDGVLRVASHRVVEIEAIRAGAEPNVQLQRRKRPASGSQHGVARMRASSGRRFPTRTEPWPTSVMPGLMMAKSKRSSPEPLSAGTISTGVSK